MNFIAKTSTPAALSLEDIKKATNDDPNLKKIIETIRTGRWFQNPDMDSSTFTAFKNVKDSLCVNSDHNIILNGNLIVIPKSLQQTVINIAHEGHQGISKTKALLRSKVWFPNMNAAVETAVKSCIPCQANSNQREYEPLNMSELPNGPWMHLSMDFCGPLPSGDYLLVITDEYSRYPVVEILTNISAEKVIPVVDRVFSTFGFPTMLKTDNGSPFQSNLWKECMNSCGIKHRKITPLCPQANS